MKATSLVRIVGGGWSYGAKNAKPISLLCEYQLTPGTLLGGTEEVQGLIDRTPTALAAGRAQSGGSITLTTYQKPGKPVWASIFDELDISGDNTSGKKGTDLGMNALMDAQLRLGKDLQLQLVEEIPDEKGSTASGNIRVAHLMNCVVIGPDLTEYATLRQVTARRNVTVWFSDIIYSTTLGEI